MYHVGTWGHAQQGIPAWNFLKTLWVRPTFNISQMWRVPKQEVSFLHNCREVRVRVFEEHDLLTDVCSPAHADAIGMRHVRWENPRVPSSRTKFSLPHDCFTPHVFPTSVGASGKGLVQSLFQCLGLTSRTEMKYIKTQEETAETHGSVTSFIPTRLVGGFVFFIFKICVSVCLQADMCQNVHFEVRGQLWRAGPLWDPESECRPSDLCSKYLCLLKLTCFRLDVLQT